MDTSAWYPLIVADHADHLRVKAATEEALHAGARLVTSNLVIAETQVLLLYRAGRPAATTFIQTVYLPPMIVLDSSADIERRAIDDWIARYEDQAFSLADAVSFVMMQRRGILQALTLDRHFAAAGFRMLPGVLHPARKSRRQAVSR